MVRQDRRDLDRINASPPSTEVGRSPLTAAAHQKCSRELLKGEVKRCSQRGPLVGYFLACPGCGYPASYLDEEVHFVEDPPPDGARWPRLLVGITNPPKCFLCKSLMTVERTPAGVFLIARRPA